MKTESCCRAEKGEKITVRTEYLLIKKTYTDLYKIIDKSSLLMQKVSRKYKNTSNYKGWEL